MPDNTRAPIVQLREARLGYPTHPVLHRIDLTVWPGEVVAVLGQSGSGKTTLVSSMLGILAPLAGEIELLGEPVPVTTRSRRQQLFARIGVVYQQDALFSNMTVAENLAVVAREQTDLHPDIVRDLIRLRLLAVGLQGFEDRPPDSLSGGQRKRLAFARAIMLEPDLVVCDEPTAGLDPRTGSKLAALIASLARDLGATLLVITHDLALIRSIASRVLIVYDGRIYADGTPAELARSGDPIITSLLGSSAENSEVA